MLVTEQLRLKEDIAAWIKQHGSNRSSMIPVLQEISGRYNEITPYAMQEVADLLDIHPVEVYSVVTFYSFLNEKKQGKFIIRLCRTISCDMAGKEVISRLLENELGIAFGETTADGNFTLEWASCIGMCDQGPAMLVNDQVFTKLTPEKAHEIIHLCKRSFGPLASEKDGMGVSG